MSYIDFIRGLGAKKRLGQNFLIDKETIRRELIYCAPKGKKILEIGPGLGALTYDLARDAVSLTVIEIDERFIPILKEKLREFKNVTIIHGDFLEFTGGPYDLIVSNLPYCIASKILFKLAEFDFKEAVVCIQAELADRILAKACSRDYSRLSVMSQLLFDVQLLERIPPSSFYPKPKVDSTVIRLTRKSEKLPEHISLFINAIFQHRNKKLRNAIVDSHEMLGIQKKEAVKIANSFSLADRRTITLTKEEILLSYMEFKVRS